MTIYYIQNQVNDKTYIGQTIQKIEQRFHTHRSRLRKGNHSNSYLQRSWDKYGKENFLFGVLEDDIKSLKELNRAEGFWVMTLKSRSFQWGYNLKTPGDNEKHSEETKRQMSVSRQGENHPMFGIKGEDHPLFGVSRPNHSERMKGELNPMWGKTHDKDARRKISEANLGKTLSAEQRKKISEANKGEKNSFYGKTHSNSDREKMSRAVGGKPVIHIPSGETFFSSAEAARQKGCSPKCVSDHVNNKVKTPRFKYIEE